MVDEKQMLGVTSQIITQGGIIFLLPEQLKNYFATKKFCSETNLTEFTHVSRFRLKTLNLEGEGALCDKSDL